jgi:hypothetical protein
MVTIVVMMIVEDDPGELVVVRLDGEVQRRAQPGDETEQREAQSPRPLQTFAGSTHGAEPTGSRPR